MEITRKCPKCGTDMVTRGDSFPYCSSCVEVVSLDPTKKCIITVTPGPVIGDRQTACADCSRHGVVASGSARLVMELAMTHEEENR